ncbi:hypothetical protein MtrunA17_Chr4g0018661 [Medicago truncatula]|uniref:Uncharacterized protein n=1 Tax=Medicago truncatula TaxID=3880 RepID=A0A396IAH7_MEDTR|nr:hypothetical protein MtrunA17_Chr4g0018661 [Medicago truncatula]
MFLCLTSLNTSNSAKTPPLRRIDAFGFEDSFLMAMISPLSFSALYTVPPDPLPILLPEIDAKFKISSAVKFNSRQNHVNSRRSILRSASLS